MGSADPAAGGPGADGPAVPARDGTEDTVDVAVVGYGPVGMALAGLLGRAGHSVLVLERYPGLYNLPRAASFDDETMRTLARLGVAGELLPKLRVQPTYEWRNARRDLLIEQRFAEVGRSGWAEWYMMYQPDLEDALDRVCRSAPRVDVRHAHRVVALEQDPSGVRLTVDGPGGRRRLAARYVVGCDGGNSFVRSALGTGLHDYGFAEPWMVCDFRFRRPTAVPPALQLGDPAGPTSIISLGPAHHRFSFMLDSADAFTTERAPARVWERVGGFLAPGDAELIRVATYTFRSLVADRWRHGRVLLAGDSAHQMPPFLGQGMCSGFRDAQNLAFKLDLVLCAAADDQLLDTYQQEREPHVRAVTERGIELGHLQTLRDPERAAERDRALLARRAVGAAHEPVRLPDLAEGMFARTSGPGRGQLSTQGVVDDGLRRDLLDQVVGGGFHLLLAPGLGPEPERLPVLGALTRAGASVVAPGERSGRAAGVRHVHDVDGTYRRWFAELGCSAVAVRPDFYVFGTARGPEATARLAGELLGAMTGPVPAG
ncbi:bifunctional 3-(3-hydroxy-phenyl)propionate/3-hydroxycinnamic acid hydroxylase [Streptomyces sp. NPDC021020]|uniref:bifunctional 3-(3-hydroxy-phenyl)propionate/3-hydroxycinnamic acid hydroxylase n=1 Tax=Streptomyces sp. NPDC021020 TaxID=3365109 RepID=UPI0037A307CC